MWTMLEKVYKLSAKLSPSLQGIFFVSLTINFFKKILQTLDNGSTIRSPLSESLVAPSSLARIHNKYGTYLD